MVYKANSLIIIFLTLFLLVSCNTNADTPVSVDDRIKKIIDYNVALLFDYMGRNNSIDNYRPAVDFINDVKVGSCDIETDLNTIETSLSIISTFSFKENVNIEITVLLLKCISKTLVYKKNQDDLYLPLVSMMISRDSDITAFKLTYEILFLNYVPLDQLKLGLIEFSMLQCNFHILDYLEQQGYMVNAHNKLNNSDYFLFKQSVDAICIKPELNGLESIYN